MPNKIEITLELAPRQKPLVQKLEKIRPTTVAFGPHTKKMKIKPGWTS